MHIAACKFQAVILEGATCELGAVVSQYLIWEPISVEYLFDELDGLLSFHFSCWLRLYPLSEFLIATNKNFVATLSSWKRFEDVKPLAQK